MEAVAVGDLAGRPVVVSGGQDATVRVWDLATGAPVGEPLTGQTGPVGAVAFGDLAGRPVVVSGGWDATVRVWDVGRGSQLCAITLGFPARDISVCGVVLAVGTDAGLMVITLSSELGA